MGKIYDKIPAKVISFIDNQKIFFVATAAPEGRVNLSPKGMDTFHVADPGKILWLNVTGSGNETAAHIGENPRMTVMFCSFDKKPQIVRLYGNARDLRPGDSGWVETYSLFKPLPGARQIFVLDIDLVHTSCGYGVPFFEYSGERDTLKEWAKNKGEEGIKKYWAENNSRSIDGNKIKI